MDLLRDIRFAGRLLVKNRWFTVMAVVVLALGIGANNAVFTIVNGVLLRNLPVAQPEEIMFLGTRDTQGRNQGVSLRDFEDWRAATRTFAGMSFLFNGAFNVGNEGLTPDQIPGGYVSPNLFKMLGVSPALGRDFTPAEETPGTPIVVLISNTVWRQRYGSDPNIVGKPIRIIDQGGTIIGVMPEGMHFPFNANIWLPTGAMPPAITGQPRQARGYFAVGRLNDGVTVEQARAELKTIGTTLAAQYPETNKDLWPHADPFVERILGPQISLLFWALMGAVGFVLLIACSNVANLLLAKAAGRSSEMSVRVAVGASRWQIVRQLLIESILLALVAGVVGLLLSIVWIRWFSLEAQNVGIPYWMVFSMDWRTSTFFLIVCLATGLIFGLIPALHASATNVHEMLKEGGRTGAGGIRARRWSGALIVVQIALTLVLLAGAGLMLRSFFTMYRMDIGIDTSRLVVTGMIIPATKYAGWEDRTRFLQRIDEHFATVSEIESGVNRVGAPIQWRRRATARGRWPCGHSGRAPPGGHDAERWLALLRCDRRAAAPWTRLYQRRWRTRAADRDRQSATRRSVLQGTGPHRPHDPPVARRHRRHREARVADRRRPRAECPSAQQQPGSRTRCHCVHHASPEHRHGTSGKCSRTHAQQSRAGNQDPARGHDGRRSGSGAGYSEDDGRVACAKPLAAARIHDNVFDICRHGARPGGGRLVRGHGVRRNAAYARHRRAHGARRAAGTGDLAVSQTIDHSVGDRPHDRRRCGVRSRPGASVVSRADERA